MCGKSIRVPNLDGSIDPIPSPELNLKDSQLVEALGELAEIGKSRPAAEVTSPPRVSETQEATVIVPAAERASPPKAVPVQPAVPAADEDLDTIIQGGNDGGTVVEPEDPLRSLAAMSRTTPADFRRKPTRNRWSVWAMAASAVAAMGLLAVIWLNGGRDAQPPPLEAASHEPSPSGKADDRPRAGNSVIDPHATPSAGETDRALEPAVTGRVTFVTDSGDTQPDRGARILLLPQSKPGSVKLDVAGFLAGAEEVDADVAGAAIRALGGDLATADADGRYELAVRAAGDYQLLVISRHRSRETTTPVDSRLQETLSAYFFRPASLLGGLSFHFDEFHYRGQGTSPRDFSFSAQ